MPYKQTPLKLHLNASGEAESPRLVLATHNPGKVREFADLLKGLWWGEVIGAADAGLVPPEETGGSFQANATLKAEAACAASGCWSLADDSGLCVDALGGRPGVDTASYGGYEKLLAALKGVGASDPTAHFVCVLSLARPNQPTLLFEATEPGHIAIAPSGEGGFGYDPVFIPTGQTRTYAQLGMAFKTQHSHRAQAFRLLGAWLFQNKIMA